MSNDPDPRVDVEPGADVDDDADRFDTAVAALLDGLHRLISTAGHRGARASAGRWTTAM